MIEVQRIEYSEVVEGVTTRAFVVDRNDPDFEAAVKASEAFARSAKVISILGKKRLGLFIRCYEFRLGDHASHFMTIEERKVAQEIARARKAA